MPLTLEAIVSVLSDGKPLRKSDVAEALDCEPADLNPFIDGVNPLSLNGGGWMKYHPDQA